MKKAAPNTSIRVFCRLRPLNKLELSQGGECCVEYSEKNIRVKVAGEEKPHDFGFDGIFGPETSQVEVFNKVARPVIERLMEGYNGTIFAYGQTSSGKTFTMEGPDVIDSEDAKGIIPRMMSHLFNLILNSSENIEFHVKVSFLELYNEKLQDLLDPRKNNLQIKEDKVKGIFVQDATEIYVNSVEQMRQVHKSGYENKTTAATRMNERSSRSHSIFVLHVIQKDIKTEASKSSKLYFVDLAGSEKVAKTNVSGQQLEEAKNINKSLTSLGMVINALTEKEKGHVPYRDSKLTRLLQESLGGNSQTSLILACSMCSYNDKETVGTLRFGNRAKNIKNTPVVNVERSVKELVVLLEAAEKKIKDQDEIIQSLQQQLDSSPVSANSSYVDLASASARERPENMLEAIEEREKTPKTPGLLPPQAQATFQAQSQAALTDRSAMIEQPLANLPVAAGAGSTSLTLLKQHIEIVNLNEEIQELRLSKKELENDLSIKNQEVYDLAGKVLQYESQIQELTSKNLNAVEEYQVKFEKICSDNQTNQMLMNKFKRAVSRLKSDLNFAFISKNLKMLDTDDKTNRSGFHDESHDFNNKEDLIVNSIQKTIEMLEEIEKDLEEKQESQSYFNEVEALMETFATHSDVHKKMFGKKSLFNTKQSDTGSGGFKSNPTEVLTTGTDEEAKIITTIATEESVGESENLKTEFDDDDYKMQFQLLTDDEKVIELQNLVSKQRKTISNLNKMNNELSKANNKHQSSQDKKIESYKIKIGDLQKFNAEKMKEYDRKIQGLKILLEEKIKEIGDVKRQQEKELLDKGKVLNDLKFQNDRMQKIILGNDLAKRVFELETKIKDLTLERQKLFEDLFKLRGEVDTKDELLIDKNAQIEILQANLNTFSSEIEIMKHFRPKQASNPTPKKEKRDSVSNVSNLEGNKAAQAKKDKGFFDKNVVKPIRGGGGNIHNFERDNFLIFEKPSVLEAADMRKNPRAGEKLSRHEAGLSAESRPARVTSQDNFKKFDQILMNKGTGNGISRGKTLLTVPTMEDEDEPNYADVKEKLKVYTSKHNNDGQKSIKSFFSGVKNLFS